MVRLDRLRFVCPRDGFKSVGKPPPVPGFKTVADTFVAKKKGKDQAYRRVRRLVNPTTGTKIHIQYVRSHGWLKPLRVTVIGPDSTGILWPELKAIGDAFRSFLIRMLELAFDFSPDCGVNREFVLKHGRFGKSRRVKLARYPDSLRYGTRLSEKMVRCYFKKEVNAYRVELEFHSTCMLLPETDFLLWQFNVTRDDFSFMKVDWEALDAHLRTKGPSGTRIAEAARSKYTSLQRLLRYLRRAGVNNPHRFLRTMKKDEWIRQAIGAWCFSVGPGGRATTKENEENAEQQQGEWETES